MAKRFNITGLCVPDKEKFVEHFEDLYQGCSDSFVEDMGRRLFLLYLRLIINGRGIIILRRGPKISAERMWWWITAVNSM